MPNPVATDIRATLSQTTPYRGRTPQTSENAMENAFAVLGETAETGSYAGTFQGESAWERHPNGDELVQVLDGATRLTILGDGTEKTVLELTAGMMTIVPRGAWHKFEAPESVTVMTLTPQPTDHSNAEDPRRT